MNHPIFVHASSLDRGSVLATHNNEIFLACGREIRYSKDESYQILLKVPHDVTHLVLNKSRTILIAYGSDTSVIHLSRTLKIKSTQLGIKPQKVLFHPYGASDNILVILSEDLRLYDLSTQDEEVVELPRKSSMLDPSPVSFCFGTYGDGWATFSVFVLMSNGDVYVVCPFLPREIVMAAPFEDAYTEPGTASAVSHARIQQAIERGVQTSNGFAFARPSRLQSPTVVGPVLLSPPPLEFSKAEVCAYDITFIASQPLNMLLIASSDKVDVCYISQEIIPRIGHDLTISVHESILLKRSGYFMDNMLIGDGIIEIQCQAGMDELTDAFESESVREIAKDGLASDVRVLTDGRIIGCAMINDIDPQLLVIKQNYQVEYIPLLPPVEPLEKVDPPQIKYSSLLSAPAYRATVNLDRIPATPRQINSDIDSLQAMADCAIAFRLNMERMMNAIVSMHRRIDLQQREFERQRSKMEMQIPEPNDRLDRVKAKQEALQARSAKLVQALLTSNSPKLSDAEKKYFKEIKRIQCHVQKLETRMEASSSDYRALDIKAPATTIKTARLRDQISGADEVITRSRAKLERLIRLSG